MCITALSSMWMLLFLPLRLRAIDFAHAFDMVHSQYCSRQGYDDLPKARSDLAQQHVFEGMFFVTIRNKGHIVPKFRLYSIQRLI